MLLMKLVNVMRWFHYYVFFLTIFQNIFLIFYISLQRKGFWEVHLKNSHNLLYINMTKKLQLGINLCNLFWMRVQNKSSCKWPISKFFFLITVSRSHRFSKIRFACSLYLSRYLIFDFLSLKNLTQNVSDNNTLLQMSKSWYFWFLIGR